MKVKPILYLFLFALIMASCDSAIQFPPVSQTPTDNINPGQFVWHDLATYDPSAAQSFYSDVFGWQFEMLGAGDNVYYVIKSDGVPIGGMFKLAEKYGRVAEWIGSMSVADVDMALQYNTSAGGKTVFRKATFNGRGVTALVQDPQGAFVAFLRAEGGDPQPIRPAMSPVNDWLWNELWTTDLEGSLKYYSGLTKNEASEVKGSKVPFYLFQHNNQTLYGAIGNPVKDARSSWMPYIKVKDVDATMKKAVAAGAHVMMEPNPSIRKGTVAVLTDPTGGQFTIQQWILK